MSPHPSGKGYREYIILTCHTVSTFGHKKKMYRQNDTEEETNENIYTDSFKKYV